MYGMVTIVNNTVLYIWKFFREQILKFSSQETKIVITWVSEC